MHAPFDEAAFVASFRDDAVAEGASRLAAVGAMMIERRGGRGDFSEASLEDLDGLISDAADDISGDEAAAFACYLGETIRSQLGGDWVVDAAAPQLPATPALRLPRGTRCWPLTRIRLRATEASAATLNEWFAALSEAEGGASDTGWWDRIKGSIRRLAR